MTKEQLTEKIKEIAKESTGTDLTEEGTLKECGLDSLSLVAVIAGIEETFGFFFRDNDLEPDKLKTLGELVSLTEKYL